MSKARTIELSLVEVTRIVVVLTILVACGLVQSYRAGFTEGFDQGLRDYVTRQMAGVSQAIHERDQVREDE